MTVIASVDYPLSERDVEVVEGALHVADERSDSDVTVLHVDTGDGTTTEADLREEIRFSFPEFRGEVDVRRATDVPATIEAAARERDAAVVVLGEPGYAEKLRSALLDAPQSVAEAVAADTADGDAGDGTEDGPPFEVTVV